MAKKNTKRKAFSFLRSYFDVLNELDNDKDKLDFLLTIINKQFLDEDPKDLNFVVNLCYESQRHQIESSVNGWKRANNTTFMGDPPTPLGTNPPTPLGTNPPTLPKEEEEEEKEEEKEKEKEKEKVSDADKVVIDYSKLLEIFNQITNRQFKTVPDKARRQIKARLKEGFTKKEFIQAIRNAYNDEYHISTKHKYLTLEYISRPNQFEKWLHAKPSDSKKVDNLRVDNKALEDEMAKYRIKTVTVQTNKK